MSELTLDDALFGEVLSPRVQQIIRLEREADDAQWEAARLIVEELTDGKSQVRLAREIGKSQSHVSLMAKTWRYYLGNSDRPSFNAVYHSPEIRTASEKPDPTSAPEPLPLGGLEAPEPDPPSAEHPPPEQQPADDGAQDLDCDTSEDLDNGPEPLAPSPLPPPQVSSGGGVRLEHLRRVADDEERANPEEPVTELLDTQRAFRALISRTRPFRAAGLRVNTVLADRIDALYQEWRGLL